MKPFVLTEENYYSAEANRKFMSVSQYKDFIKCEAQAVAKLNGLWTMPKTTALMVGSYVDRYFEGTLDEFKRDNPEIFKKDGSLKADYVKAEDIIARIEADGMFMDYMGGKKQVIETAEMFDAEWKIKIDSLHKDKIVDLKIMRSMDRVMGMSFIEYWGYDVQMAVYQAVHTIATGERLPVYLAVATKEDVTDIAIINIPQWRLDECLEQVRKDMPRILSVKKGESDAEKCGVCDVCKITKVLTEPVDFTEVGFSNAEMRAMRGSI